jgi:hypothetical protein
MKWARWTLGGVGIGALVGLWIGGMGLALLGTAIAIKSWLVLGGLFGYVGHRIGLSKKPIRVEPEQLKG